MRNKLGILCTILLIFFINSKLKSQETDTIQSILKITKLYEKIDNENIENLKIDTIILSDYPTDPNSEGSTYVNANRYIIFYNDKDTFLIRNIAEWDVGSGYSIDQSDVFFWNKKPFFYYMESETVLGDTGIKKCTQIYIENDIVIRKLHKQATFWTKSGGYIKVDIDNIPYETIRIEVKDYETIKDFINKSILEMTNTDN